MLITSFSLHEKSFMTLGLVLIQKLESLCYLSSEKTRVLNSLLNCPADMHLMLLTNTKIKIFHNLALIFQVLEKGRAKPVPQTEYGAIYNTNNYMTFTASTFDPENLV